MTTIQIRIDEKTKRKARKVFNKMGLDVSTGIKLYLARVAQDEKVPFVLRTENGYTPQEEQRLLRDAAHAKRYGKRYTSVKEALDDMLGR